MKSESGRGRSWSWSWTGSWSALSSWTVTVTVTMLLLFFISLTCEPVQSEEILVLLPMASKSHKNVFQPMVEALAKRGHSITFVTPFMPSKPKANIRDMVVSNFTAGMLKKFGNPFDRRTESPWTLMMSNAKNMVLGCEDIYKSQEFLNLLHQKFDLILLDAFGNDCLAGFVHKLGSPLVLVSPLAAPGSVTQHAGNRLPPSFVPHAILPFQDRMSFTDRLTNVGFNVMWDILVGLYMNPMFEAVYRTNLGQESPGITEIYGNISLILMNSHFTLTFPRPTLPDVVEVGGMQCGPAKALPKDLEDFISGAKDGVVFFSLGSIIQGDQMPEHVRKIFLNVFSRLKERVLWKWETEEMADLPKNVKLGKWLPQQDILGHKNVKLFITHGGLLSTQEATYHGVPLIGTPIFGDQNLNMKQAERAGFTDRAKELSKLFRDQTQTPLERAVFWSEYVMRHKGAPHLRSAARKLNFFQYHSLDVIATLAAILIIILWVIKIVVVKIVRVVLSTLSLGLRKSGSTSSASVVQKEVKKNQ